MANILDDGYATWDAGQGAGAVDVSATFEIDGQLFEDARQAVPFNAWGAQRIVEFPGLIGATRMIGRYVPADTSVQQYEDAIAAFDANTLQTFVLQPESGSPSTTIHQLTITGYLSLSPTSGWGKGGFVHYPVNLFVHSVVHYDGTTTYTWA